MSGQAVDDALDGIAHVLRCCDDEAAGHQHHRREDVVQSKDGTVCCDLLELQVVLQPSQQLVHFGRPGTESR